MVQLALAPRCRTFFNQLSDQIQPGLQEKKVAPEQKLNDVALRAFQTVRCLIDVVESEREKFSDVDLELSNMEELIASIEAISSRSFTYLVPLKSLQEDLTLGEMEEVQAKIAQYQKVLDRYEDEKAKDLATQIVTHLKDDSYDAFVVVDLFKQGLALREEAKVAFLKAIEPQSLVKEFIEEELSQAAASTMWLVLKEFPGLKLSPITCLQACHAAVIKEDTELLDNYLNHFQANGQKLESIIQHLTSTLDISSIQKALESRLVIKALKDDLIERPKILCYLLKNYPDHGLVVAFISPPQVTMIIGEEDHHSTSMLDDILDKMHSSSCEEVVEDYRQSMDLILDSLRKEKKLNLLLNPESLLKGEASVLDFWKRGDFSFFEELRSDYKAELDTFLSIEGDKNPYWTLALDNEKAFSELVKCSTDRMDQVYEVKGCDNTLMVDALAAKGLWPQFQALLPNQDTVNQILMDGKHIRPDFLVAAFETSAPPRIILEQLAKSTTTKNAHISFKSVDKKKTAFAQICSRGDIESFTLIQEVFGFNRKQMKALLVQKGTMTGKALTPPFVAAFANGQCELLLELEKVLSVPLMREMLLKPCQGYRKKSPLIKAFTSNNEELFEWTRKLYGTFSSILSEKVDAEGNSWLLYIRSVNNKRILKSLLAEEIPTINWLQLTSKNISYIGHVVNSAEEIHPLLACHMIHFVSKNMAYFKAIDPNHHFLGSFPNRILEATKSSMVVDQLLTFMEKRKVRFFPHLVSPNPIGLIYIASKRPKEAAMRAFSLLSKKKDRAKRVVQMHCQLEPYGVGNLFHVLAMNKKFSATVFDKVYSYLGHDGLLDKKLADITPIEMGMLSDSASFVFRAMSQFPEGPIISLDHGYQLGQMPSAHRVIKGIQSFEWGNLWLGMVVDPDNGNLSVYHGAIESRNYRALRLLKDKVELPKLSKDEQDKYDMLMQRKVCASIAPKAPLPRDDVTGLQLIDDEADYKGLNSFFKGLGLPQSSERSITKLTNNVKDRLPLQGLPSREENRKAFDEAYGKIEIALKNIAWSCQKLKKYSETAALEKEEKEHILNTIMTVGEHVANAGEHCGGRYAQDFHRCFSTYLRPLLVKNDLIAKDSHIELSREERAKEEVMTIATAIKVGGIETYFANSLSDRDPDDGLDEIMEAHYYSGTMSTFAEHFSIPKDYVVEDPLAEAPFIDQWGELVTPLTMALVKNGCSADQIAVQVKEHIDREPYGDNRYFEALESLWKIEQEKKGASVKGAALYDIYEMGEGGTPLVWEYNKKDCGRIKLKWVVKLLQHWNVLK